MMGKNFFINYIFRWFLAIQINPLNTAKSLLMLPHFFHARQQFLQKMNEKNWKINTLPMLLDCKKQAANLGEYFWQDLYVAKKIIAENPRRHIDVGSRIDGFIAHLACVRNVEIFDIRELQSKIENVQYVQWDITNPRKNLEGVSDCVTCLHTLEHIGLGRYGDGIEPNGWKQGFASLSKLVAPGGGLWISVPVGQQRIEFNAHRVFAPMTICQEAKCHDLTLEEFCFIENGVLSVSKDIEKDFAKIILKDYCLGIYHFRRLL